MISFTEFLSELKARNVRKTMAIYFSSALTAIGVIKLLIEVYDIPERIFPVAVTVLLCGVVSAFIFAWFHGKEGVQKFQKREATLHLLVLAVAVFICFRVGNAPARELPVQRLGKSIAVLPFENLSDNKQDEYFSDGIMEDILTQLSKINELRVISRTSVMKYKGKDSLKTIREIGKELGVAAVLRGSVRRDGNRVRITAGLINSQNEETIWSQQYDRGLKDIFYIQSEVAQKIGAALKARLLPEEKKLIEKKVTENLEAYGYYLRGKDVYYGLTKEDNESAIDFFKKAIALDSTYALAFAGLADTYAQRVQRFNFSPQWADSSIALSKHAISLDPNIAEPYKSLGLAYYQREWYGQAIEQYERALSLNPNFATVYANMGELKLWMGHQDEAIRLAKKAISLSPGRVPFYNTLAIAYSELEMDSTALRWFQKGIELQPSLRQLYVGLGELYLAENKIPKARQTLRGAIEKEPDYSLLLETAGKIELHDRNNEGALVLFRKAYDLSESKTSVLVPLAFALAKTGKQDEAEEFLNRCYAEAQRSIAALSEEGTPRYYLACIYAIRNNIPEALLWLRESITLGSRSYRLTVRDPLLENLHDNPEFKAMMEELRSKKLKLRTRVEEEERTQQLTQQ